MNPEWWSALASGAAAVIAIAAAAISFSQAIYARRQAESSEKSATAADKQALLAEEQAKYALQSANAAERSSEQSHLQQIQLVGRALSEVESGLLQLIDAFEASGAFIKELDAKIADDLHGLLFTTLTVSPAFDKQLETATRNADKFRRAVVRTVMGEGNEILDLDEGYQRIKKELWAVRLQLEGPLSETRAAIHKA